ncbi:MAG: hypothetical protein QY323_03610 [Patescibacteria group bacterium]|nr:MAG: hypothetical protein QY323_03610 [Patescibacteria group bacterium]
MPRKAHKPPYAAPPGAGRTKAQQELLLGVLVGVSMLAITGLYALTLRYQKFGTQPSDAPRWSVLADGVVTRAMPIKTTLLEVSDALGSIVRAQRTQSEALATLKAKIAAGAATTTPETENETSAADEALADQP